LKSIGGYFSLELQTGEHFHKNAIKFNSARNCLMYVLLIKQYKKIYIPYYTCEVILEPLKKLKIKYQFYHVNELLEPVETFDLSDNEVFLYTNYFGIKNEAVKKLSKIYGNRLIIDNAQAFFAFPEKGIDTIYSPRKFFGVADGGFLYTDEPLNELNDLILKDKSFDRMSHLLKRIDLSAEDAYADFQKNDKSLTNEPIRIMSKLTDAILRSIDYDKVKKIRQENFQILDLQLKKENLLSFDFSSQEMVPMVYPFWSKDKTLRKRLIANKIYVATYWSNVFKWCKENDLDYTLAQNIIPLPIDQRYGKKEMQKIIKIIHQH
jgi:hypothetical protein